MPNPLAIDAHAHICTEETMNLLNKEIPKVASSLKEYEKDVFEWSVCGVIYTLNRFQRAREDLPPLLFIAALFWTGPLIATMEMNAQRAELGFLLSAGVCLFALHELHFVHHPEAVDVEKSEFNGPVLRPSRVSTVQRP